MLKSSPFRQLVCIGCPAHEQASSSELLPFTAGIQLIPALISSFISIASNDLELSDTLFFQLSGLPRLTTNSHCATSYCLGLWLHISILGLPYQITSTEWLQNNRNIFSHSFGGQKSKTKVLAGPCSLWWLYGKILLCLFRVLVASGITWLGAKYPHSLPPSLCCWPLHGPFPFL